MGSLTINSQFDPQIGNHVDLHSNLIQFWQLFAFLFDPPFLNQAQLRLSIHQVMVGQFYVQNLGQITVQINTRLMIYPILVLYSIGGFIRLPYDGK